MTVMMIAMIMTMLLVMKMIMITIAIVMAVLIVTLSFNKVTKCLGLAKEIKRISDAQIVLAFSGQLSKKQYRYFWQMK